MYVLDTVIERKCVDDLAASIKDGRYERQKYFLARWGVRRTMYVLEGDVDLAFQVRCPSSQRLCRVATDFRRDSVGSASAPTAGPCCLQCLCLLQDEQ